ncbi:hypothetical protein L207DRAFT_636131 [Hyaloscypha variabilis F]|uniref:Uncharacterized protein n=1 Tax=Hyaloscypha variabilis (strain UAMH 11265 / GT02V1 / F) TaxID=1149755 RepID=A0A2J6RFY8_HYAVF|nr:hypothetical protein L207DRAFT_636131 [Hyaloscypha variabilis F]
MTTTSLSRTDWSNLKLSWIRLQGRSVNELILTTFWILLQNRRSKPLGRKALDPFAICGKSLAARERALLLDLFQTRPDLSKASRNWSTRVTRMRKMAKSLRRNQDPMCLLRIYPRNRFPDGPVGSRRLPLLPFSHSCQSSKGVPNLRCPQNSLSRKSRECRPSQMPSPGRSRIPTECDFFRAGRSLEIKCDCVKDLWFQWCHDEYSLWWYF